MIDLEEALSALVERAPEPPDVAGVARRARQRRLRRRSTLVAIIVVVAIATSGAIALRPTSNAKRPILQKPTIESVRVTLLDGSQLEISGPPSLGLTKLEPAFNAALDLPLSYNLPYDFGHSFAVERRAPEEPGRVVGRYPTRDGHELVVYSTTNGVDAVVQYEHWALVVTWNRNQTNWPVFASALKARETIDGFLVIEPTAPWHLGPTDAPDMQLGGTSSGDGPTFSFFGPKFYRSGCPAKLMTSTQTPQGWHVGVGAVGSRFWCDDNTRMRVVAWDPNLIDDAIQGLRVRRMN